MSRELKIPNHRQESTRTKHLHGGTFIHPSARLTPAQVTVLRQSGIIPIEDEKGETSRYVPIRLDSTTLKELRVLKLRLKGQGKKPTDSEVLRLVLLKGLEHVNDIENPKEVEKSQ